MNRRVTSILIADRDEIFRHGMARVLERDGRFRIVATCSDTSELIAAMRRRVPSVAVVDARLFGDDRTAKALSSRAGVQVVVVGVTDAIPDARSIRRDFRIDDLIAMLDESGISVSRRPVEGVEALSPREQQVLRMVADGLTSREIAEELEIKQRTVEVHRHNILSKLELRGVAEMVKFAIREGLTTA